MVENLPAMQETWVQSLGQECPLEKAMTTHSSIPAWKIPWTEEARGLTVQWVTRVGYNLATKPPPMNSGETGKSTIPKPHHLKQFLSSCVHIWW